VSVAGLVEVAEVLPVMSQHRAALGVSKGQHGVVGDPLAGLAYLTGR
jgi:hypothetical protein